MTSFASYQPLSHFHRGDPVDRIFGNLSGRTPYSAHAWLGRGHQTDVALALRAFREAEAWHRRESWAAPLRVELEQLPERVLDDDLILEHLASDLNDDHWRVAFLNRRDIESRRQWCRALSRTQPLNLQVMVALKQEDR